MPHSSIVPTPTGDRKFGDLEVGDQVFGLDGKPTNVIAIYEQGITETYRVTFSDGTSTLAGIDHLWGVTSRYGGERKWINKETLSTRQIIANGVRCGYRDKEYKYRIPLISPVYYDEKELLIPPYTMGALIANGSMQGYESTVRTPDIDVWHRIKNEGVDVSDLISYSGECPRISIRGIHKHIRHYGLDVRSAEKFIPYDYLVGSIDQRISLLRGLMDGDGGNPSTYSDHHKNSLKYFTTSPKLADDVVRLVNTLGGTATKNSRPRVDAHERGYEDISLHIMLPEEIREDLFTARKEYRPAAAHRHVPHRCIASIEREGSANQRCITVDSEDSLYAISENYIMTHNTAFVVNMMHRMKMVQPDIKIMVLSLEQTRNEFFDRMHKLHAFYDPTVQAIDTVNLWQDSMLLIDKNAISEREVEDSVYQFIYETGEEPDLMIVDYLGYFARGCKGVSEYDRTTNAIMDLKALAKNLQLTVFAPHQANRTGEFGAELSADQAKSSGAVEETSDVMITMWAPDAAKHVKDEDKNGEVFQRIVKNRNGPANMLVKYQWAPLSMAMVPLNDINYLQHAVRERKYAAAGDTREEALKRRLSGSLTI